MHAGPKPENISDFFDGIVRDLHKQHIFDTFDEPEGEPVKERSFTEKVTHYLNHKKNAAGLRFHIGDQGYNTTLSEHVLSKKSKANSLQPSQKEILEKTRSIQDAIKSYIPEDKFTAYLRYFAENLDRPENKKFLDRSFYNMVDQLSVYASCDEKAQINSDQLEKFINLQTTEARKKNFNKLFNNLSFKDRLVTPTLSGSKYRYLAPRDYVRRSKNYAKASEFPELLLSLVIYQAAHISYRDEMEKAIDRNFDPDKEANSLLSADEHENALSVIRHSFVQFREFLIFESLFPLIIHEREKLENQANKNIDPHELTQKAITNGWKAFFKSGMLKNDILSNAPFDSPDYESKRLTVRCPAKPHLKTTQVNGTLEILFNNIVAHKASLTPWLNDTRNFAVKSLKGEIPIHLKNIKRSEPDYLNQIMKYAKTLEIDLSGNPIRRLNKDESLITQQEAKKIIPLLGIVSDRLQNTKSDHLNFEVLHKTLEIYINATSICQPNARKVILTTKIKKRTFYCLTEKDCLIENFDLQNISKTINHAFSQLPDEPELQKIVYNAMPERAQKFLTPPPKHAERIASGRANPNRCSSAVR